MMNTIRNSVLAASAVLALGALATGSASASWNPDPYTYTANQNVRADVGTAFDDSAAAPSQQAIYDSHGHVVGFTKLAK
jgi:hypothetical protein